MICERCGECCYYEVDGRRRKCRFLIILPSGKTLCRVYKNRLSKIIYYDKTLLRGFYCAEIGKNAECKKQKEKENTND